MVAHIVLKNNLKIVCTQQITRSGWCLETLDGKDTRFGAALVVLKKTLDFSET